MQEALDLAKKGHGHVKTNPLVGCVIVRDNQVIARGYHHEYGGLHAERDALNNARASVVGATAYVTLEPCCHQGKQPACTQALIAAGIQKVVVAVGDPNPKVDGGGIRQLLDAGIEVQVGLLEDQARKLNQAFFHYIKTGLPLIALKYAMTADGKIATTTGGSRWITDVAAREHVHHLRHDYSGIMVGIGTVLADDPLLTARFEGAVNPSRIVVDSTLRIALASQLVQTARDVPTIVATTSESKEKIRALEELGVKVVNVGQVNKQVDLPVLVKKLADLGITSILVEGGARLNAALLQNGLVNKLYIYLAPKLFGGQDALSPVWDMGVESPDQAVALKIIETRKIGPDLFIESEVI